MTIVNDQRLLRLDFIAEIGDMLTVTGAAIAAAATAGRCDVIELAFRQAQNTLSEGLKEFKEISANDSGGSHE